VVLYGHHVNSIRGAGRLGVPDERLLLERPLCLLVWVRSHAQNLLVCICRSCSALISRATSTSATSPAAGSAGATDGDEPRPVIVAVRSGFFRAGRRLAFRLLEA
jgi:hypothetical protein